MLLLHLQVKRYYQVLLFVVASTLIFGDVAAQQGRIDSFIVKQMKEQSIVGLSIGIVKNGQVFLTKGYGLANAELNVKASEKTVYKIASLSKQFVAVGIMRLVQENKLNLNDTVTKFFANAPASWNGITVR